MKRLTRLDQRVRGVLDGAGPAMRRIAVDLDAAEGRIEVGIAAHGHDGRHDTRAGTDQELTALAVGLHPGLHGVTLLRPLPQGLMSLGVSEHCVGT